MPRPLRIIGLAVVIMSSCRTVSAELFTLTIVVIQDSVTRGGTVNWQLFGTVGNSTTNNFGLAAVTANLTESTADVLIAGAIGAPFSDYDFISGGTAAGNRLIEISATEFLQSNATTEARDPANGGSVAGLGPLLIVSGSYTVNTLGLHTLTPSAGSTERFFTALNQGLGDSIAFSPAQLSFAGDSFTVVPEPSALALVGGILASAGLVKRRRQRNAHRSKS